MRKIAVIFYGNPAENYGMQVSIENRVRYLRQVASYEIHPIMITCYDGFLMRLLRKSSALANRPSTISFAGRDCSVEWFKRSWLDAIGHRVWGLEPHYFLSFADRIARSLKDFDLIAAHDRFGGLVAQRVWKLYGIPYTVTWHGSDTHTLPFRDDMIMRQTRSLMRNATQNIFVSPELKEIAKRITTEFNGVVVANGVDSSFHLFSTQHRQSLRESKGVGGRKVVAFIGRFCPIKNVMLLPEIFKLIANQYDGKLAFWTFGDGPQFHDFKDALTVPVTNWGRVDHALIPQFLNCVDVLLMPSVHEGLPLAPLEAMKCGVKVVATDGCNIGQYVDPHNIISNQSSQLVQQFAQRALELLKSTAPRMELATDLSWERTAQLENELYNSLMPNN